MMLSLKSGGGNTSEQRKIMIVAEPTRESAAALRYALSHIALENDTLYLLHVENHTFWRNKISYFTNQSISSTSSSANSASREGENNGGSFGGAGGCLGGNVDFLDEMKNACEIMHPKMKVNVSKVEMGANEKGNVIISQTNLHGIDLLVVGKRHSLSTAILWQRRNGSIRGEISEYLVENCKCTCVAVQRKGQTGGYLLHTKTQRNYWLLA